MYVSSPRLALFFVATENFRKNFIHFFPRPCAWRVASVIFAVLPHLFSPLAQGNVFPYIPVFFFDLPFLSRSLFLLKKNFYNDVITDIFISVVVYFVGYDFKYILRAK